MTDPSNALVSFQKEFKLGRIRVRQCELDRSLNVHHDVGEEGTPRSTYVTLEGKTVTAPVILGLWEPNRRNALFLCWVRGSREISKSRTCKEGCQRGHSRPKTRTTRKRAVLCRSNRWG